MYTILVLFAPFTVHKTYTVILLKRYKYAKSYSTHTVTFEYIFQISMCVLFVCLNRGKIQAIDLSYHLGMTRIRGKRQSYKQQTILTIMEWKKQTILCSQISTKPTPKKDSLFLYLQTRYGFAKSFTQSYFYPQKFY